MDKKEPAKTLLTRLGALCSPRVVYELNGVFNYLHVGWWLRAHGFRPQVRLRTREDLFARLAAAIADRDVLYLEFGVREGASLRQWSRLLQNPRSALIGFDSFRGLPHDWTLEGHARGDFSTSGEAPKIDDPRVRFVVGWFDETLPDFDWPEHDVLVVMLDADLYTSTSVVLQHVKARLGPGSYLYFDQFHHRCDELRAFAELIDENPELRFELWAASRDLSNVAFKRLDDHPRTPPSTSANARATA
jgi:Macrocin-O-methyltransferase (TylF)